MLKKYLTNFIMVFCIVFACIFAIGAFILLLTGDIFSMCLCALGFVVTLSGAITLGEHLDSWE